MLPPKDSLESDITRLGNPFCQQNLAQNTASIYYVNNTRSVIQPQPAALRLPLRHLQTFPSPDALNPFAVHRPPGRAQQCRHAAITVTTILPGQSDDVLSQRLLVVGPTRHFALRRSMLPKHTAYPPPGRRHCLPHMINASPPPRRAQKFPRAASCKISLSNVRSEIARRSRPFSFSRSFIRRA